MSGRLGGLAGPARRGWYPPTFLVLVVGRAAVPVWAEAAAPTPWHPHHIAERYGLFTLIVLGESVLAASTAIQSALDNGHEDLLPVAAGGLLIVFALWWLYFAKPAAGLLVSSRVGSSGATATCSSGPPLPRSAPAWRSRSTATGHADLPALGAGAAVTIPVAIYLLTTWTLHLGPHHTGPSGSGPSRSRPRPSSWLLPLPANRS